MIKKYRYDVSISVATEDKAIAERIVAALEKQKIRCYLYDEQNAEAWGEYVLKVSLAKYGAEAKFILLIVSKVFVKKYWTIVELQVAQAFRKGQEAYILPLRIDDTRVDGIKYLGFVNWKENPEEIAAMLKKKVQLRDKKANRKKWMAAALIMALCIAGYLLYPRNEQPDYSKYFDAFNRGDSLFNSKNIPAARESYSRSLQYNPGDKAAARKLALLDSIDYFMKKGQDDSVKHVFNLIVSVPVSPGLTPQALERAGVKSNPPLQLALSWQNGTLIMTISGGVPFDNASQPYFVLGISCTNCTVWKKTATGYTASIPADKAQVLRIGLKDRLGQFLYQPVPAGAPMLPVPADLKPKTEQDSPVKDTAKQQLVAKPTAAEDYVRAGDSLYNMQKYMAAKTEYQQAAKLRPNDAGITKKIAACDEAEARNIPRVKLPGGTFSMGTANGNAADGPVHPVSISGFSISRTEVTRGQYRLYCKSTGRGLPPDMPDTEADDRLPVTNITWQEAVTCCQWLGGRLPTEAEWEYAAAAGKQYIYSGSNQADPVAWYKNNTNGGPAAVQTKNPNSFGLYDLTGNVAEWCQDWYDKAYYTKSSSAQGPSSGTERVIRGGAYNSFTNSPLDGNQLRITYRNSENPGARRPYIGFRVAWSN
jgi:formylglycine-generating enzyme